MAPLRCLTNGSIAVGHLANQKRVKQAHDQKSVTQRMRRKLAGIFCFVVNFQPRPQGFSLKKWGRPHPFFEGKALGTRLVNFVFFQEPLSHYGSWFFFPWRLANPNKNKILPRRFFGVSFRDAAAQKLNHSQTRKRSG